MSDNEKTLALLAALVGVRASGPRKPRRPRMADEIARLRDENGALHAAVERVRALHQPTPDVGSAVWTDAAGQPLLAVCHACGDDHPCPTAQALQEAA